MTDKELYDASKYITHKYERIGDRTGDPQAYRNALVARELKNSLYYQYKGLDNERHKKATRIIRGKAGYPVNQMYGTGVANAFQMGLSSAIFPSSNQYSYHGGKRVGNTQFIVPEWW